MKRRNRRPPRDYLIAIVLVVVFVWLVYMLVDIYRKEEIARNAADEARRELTALEERQMTLTQNLEDLKTERGREESYRENFGVARPGEEVIIVVSPDGEAPQTGLTWWRRFLGWFGL